MRGHLRTRTATVAVAGALALGGVACGEANVDDLGDDLEEGVDDLQDGAEDLGDEIEEGVDDLGDDG
jgi:hypothetical protein